MPYASTRPTKNADSSTVGTPDRAGSYGEAYVAPVSNKELFSADEGSYFVAITPTAGTGVIGHAAPTTFDEAKPLFVFYNGGTKNIYPQFLHLHETVASVGGARVQLTFTMDDGNRRSSAGTALVSANTHSGSANTSGLIAYMGAVVGTAATAARRLLGNVVFRGTIDIIEDDYLIVWGDPGGLGGSSSRAATVAEASRVVAPMVIAPGDSLCITQWAAAQSTGPTFEAIFGYIER